MITLEVLKEKGFFQDFLNYFQTLEKQELDVVELMERCVEDGRRSHVNWLWECIDNKEVFERAVKGCIKNGLGLDFAFIYCSHLFTQELLERVVEYYIEKGRSLYFTFRYCKDLPFFQEVMDRLGVKIAELIGN